MIYDFSHYSTDDGRRVRFIIARSDLERVRRAGFLEGEALRNVEVIETGSRAEAMLVMSPGAARVLVDVLAMVGGDAVVAARMLSSALDDMVHELRTARAIFDVTHGVRRDFRRQTGARV